MISSREPFMSMSDFLRLSETNFGISPAKNILKMSRSTEAAPHNVFSNAVLAAGVNENHRMQRAPPSKVFIHSHHSPYEAHELMQIATDLVAVKGKGIYASDEAPDIMDKLLSNTEKTPSTEEQKKEKRKAWKEAAFSSLNSGSFVSKSCKTSDLL